MTVESDIKKAPSTPGVYLYRNAEGKILYVGKASNLKSRLSSYLRTHALEPAKQRMMNEAEQVEIRETTSDIDALILEAELIKKYYPPYNVLLRDDKNYAFVAFTKEAFPRILITHQPFMVRKKVNIAKGYFIKNVRAELIGPFTETGPLKSTLSLLRRTFPYCTCAPGASHKRPCVNGEIGKCLQLCCIHELHIDPQMDVKDVRRIYRTNIRAIRAVLTGRHRWLKKECEKLMHEAAKQHEYEHAQVYRDQVWALERIFEHRPFIKRDTITDRGKALRRLQEILGLPHVPRRIEGYDISNIQGVQPVGSMVVFIDGVPDKNEYRRFRIKTIQGANDPAMMREMLTRRLKRTDWDKPDVILIDGGITQLGAAQSAAKDTGVAVHIVSIAKKEEKLFMTGKLPIKLADISPTLLHLMQHIRNESHRFAITYHRKRRKKALFDTM